MKSNIEAGCGIAARIEAAEVKQLNAVVSYKREVVREQVAVAGRRVSGEGLTGISFGIKDNICTLEYPTTCASRILQGYRSPYEATAVERIKAAGGLVACKTNLDEFGMGSSTEHSAYGRTLHPFQHDRVPGGSSGGSAALVATGAVDVALGSETGGSVRQPAAFCGVVGIKPTYGRVSRNGLVAFGSSLDQIGVLAPSVESAAATLQVISGRDPKDPTCADLDPLELNEDPADFSQFTIGIPAEYYTDGLDPGIERACREAIAVMQSGGATVREVSLPHTSASIPTYYIIAPAEASSNLARFDGVRYGNRVAGTPKEALNSMYKATRGAGFGPEVRRRILVGTYVLSAGYYDAYYSRAVAARRRIAAEFSSLFAGGIDLLFTPTTPTTAFKAGEKLDDPVAMYQADAFVCPANLAELPAASVPIGQASGLPVGGQFIAPWFDEANMLGAAGLLEKHVDRARDF